MFHIDAVPRTLSLTLYYYFEIVPQNTPLSDQAILAYLNEVSKHITSLHV